MSKSSKRHIALEEIHRTSNFWLSNGWVLGRHGCLPILLVVDLLARIGREGKKMVLIKATF
jgi:hypothetical protein